jgi:hypothetical protein
VTTQHPGSAASVVESGEIQTPGAAASADGVGTAEDEAVGQR